MAARGHAGVFNPSETEVRDAIASLPIFKAGMLEVVSLIPLKPYPGFGPVK